MLKTYTILSHVQARIASGFEGRKKITITPICEDKKYVYKNGVKSILLFYIFSNNEILNRDLVKFLELLFGV